MVHRQPAVLRKSKIRKQQHETLKFYFTRLLGISIFMDISHDIFHYVKYQSSHKYYIGETKYLSLIHMNKSDFISVFQTTLSDILMDDDRYLKGTAVPQIFLDFYHQLCTFSCTTRSFQIFIIDCGLLHALFESNRNFKHR